MVAGLFQTSWGASITCQNKFRLNYVLGCYDNGILWLLEAWRVADSHLMPEDVKFPKEVQPTPAMFIRIKESKTDVDFRVGHTIIIGGTITPLCSVLAMKQYLAIRQPKAGPLLVKTVSKPLTKLAFNASNYTGCIYRPYWCFKLPSWIIKSLDRRSSDSTL